MSLTGQEWIPSHAAHFSLERLDDEILLYHPDLTKAIQLNQTASLVWLLCDGSRSVGDIATLLGDAYPDHAAVRADVEAILERLVAEGAARLTIRP